MARAPRQLWEKRVKRLKDSGLTVKEYAAEIGVNYHTLSHWKWKLGKKGSKPGQSRRRAKKAKADKKGVAPVAFVELQPAVVAKAEGFEVELSDGRRVRVPPTFDAEALSKLLDVLEVAR